MLRHVNAPQHRPICKESKRYFSSLEVPFAPFHVATRNLQAVGVLIKCVAAIVVIAQVAASWRRYASARMPSTWRCRVATASGSHRSAAARARATHWWRQPG